MLDSTAIFSKLDKSFEDIDRLINSEKFLTGNYSSKESICITNIEDAITFATDQNVDYIKGSEYKYWTGILEDESLVVEIVHRRSILIEKELEEYMLKYDEYSSKIDHVFLSVVKEKKFPDRLVNSLASQLLGIIDILIFFDELPALWQRIYTVLEEGGFSCGWKGAYPEGEMIVYNQKA